MGAAMRFFADLHVHSKYSRATSRDCDLENLALWAQRKGLAVVATGDFTHPAWFEELRTKLVPAEPGLMRLRPDIESEVERRLPACCRAPVRFLVSVEISTIYKRDGATRKVHHLIYCPDLASADRARTQLGRIGNLASDGRPILGLDSRGSPSTSTRTSTSCSTGWCVCCRRPTATCARWARESEERRLFFVGMTRARTHLFLSYAGRRTRQGRAVETCASPFLAAIAEDLLRREESERAGPRRVRPKQLSLI